MPSYRDPHVCTYVSTYVCWFDLPFFWLLTLRWTHFVGRERNYARKMLPLWPSWIWRQHGRTNWWITTLGDRWGRSGDIAWWCGDDKHVCVPSHVLNVHVHISMHISMHYLLYACTQVACSAWTTVQMHMCMDAHSDVAEARAVHCSSKTCFEVRIMSSSRAAMTKEVNCRTFQPQRSSSATKLFCL